MIDCLFLLTPLIDTGYWLLFHGMELMFPVTSVVGP